MAVSVVAGLVALMLAISGWARRRATFGAGAFVAAAFAAAVWCWSIAAFDRLDEPGRYPYPVVGLWLAAVSACVAAVFVMSRRAVLPRWSPPRWLVGVFVLESISIFVLEVTNPWHGLVGSKPGGELVFGIAYQVHTAYCIALVLASAIALATRASRADREQRSQIVVLQVLVVAIFVVEVGQLHLSQYIAVAGLAVLHRSVFGQGLNDVVPVDLGAAVDQMGDPVFFFDTRGRLVGLNASARRVVAVPGGSSVGVGDSVETVLGTTVPLAEHVETRVVLGSGASAREAVTRCSPLTDAQGRASGWMIMCRDVALASTHSSSADSVRHDPVTGVLTRGQLDQVLRRAVIAARDEAEPLSIALLDVDAFKAINDTYGHVAGDEVLREMAERVDRAAGAATVLGRFGGDEFVAVLAGRRASEAAEVAEAMRAAVSGTPMTLGDVSARVTVTIGVAQHDGGSVADLLRAADRAMYGAKRAGRDRVGTARPSA
ncbi:histidine kinase N-terminal 7TM domain-containing diguanylate cyclase [Aeromicrobium fastidiosum]|uniref:Diguanylate cyclase n=1 Tax=Aeromicrobium fastidiosum TaxID=52699 RepID=A0A641AMZ9_9ACTN|nr:diguanylate cyclase [Aeromicrobium fastidiosum]KAA1378101.1 diguanylate cyclase [Aeromicrobium fastidiosum]MBP2389103.1 diguanylate cyclase (GGDEF)-like protein [Aeromicrobium fastidiosum]